SGGGDSAEWWPPKVSSCWSFRASRNWRTSIERRFPKGSRKWRASRSRKTSWCWTLGLTEGNHRWRDSDGGPGPGEGCVAFAHRFQRIRPAVTLPLSLPGFANMFRSGSILFLALVLAAMAQEPMLSPDPADRADAPPSDGGYAPEPERPGRAVSQSGQFRVTGSGDDDRSAAANRASVALLMEEAKNTLHRLIGETDLSWVVPVDVILEGKAGDSPRAVPVSYDLGHAGGRFSLGVR